MTISIDNVGRGRYVLNCTSCGLLVDDDIDFIKFLERTHPAECSAGTADKASPEAAQEPNA